MSFCGQYDIAERGPRITLMTNICYHQVIKNQESRVQADSSELSKEEFKQGTKKWQYETCKKQHHGPDKCSRQPSLKVIKVVKKWGEELRIDGILPF